jgi:hypothetical protein
VFDLYEAPEHTGEVIGASLRRLSVASQAVQIRVDATMIRFDVDALLVASNANALRRFHYFYEVEFTDGTTGDNGLVMIGSIRWPDEVVVFTDSGVEITLPFHWGDDEQVIFREESMDLAISLNNSEFVSFTDYAVQYVLDFMSSEQFRFSDLSIAPMGIIDRAESVTVTEFSTVKGDVSNVAPMSEYVTLAEVMTGGPIIALSDAVFMAEFWTRILDFRMQPESVTWTDVLVVSELAASDSRPGAFIPGAALLGSPT